MGALNGAGRRWVKNVTWLEVDAAFENDIPVFAFLVDPSYPWSERKEQDLLLDADDPQSMIAVGQNVRSLAAFRLFLEERAGLVREHFTTPDDLAKKLISSLAAWAEARGRPPAIPMSNPTTRRLREVRQLIEEFFLPVSKGLAKDTAIWRGIIRDRDARDTVAYKAAYQLEVNQVIPNHKAIMSIIVDWRFLVKGDTELSKALDAYLQHVAMYIAIRDSGEDWQYPELLGYPWPQNLIPLIEDRLIALQAERHRLEPMS